MNLVPIEKKSSNFGHVSFYFQVKDGVKTRFSKSPKFELQESPMHAKLVFVIGIVWTTRQKSASQNCETLWKLKTETNLLMKFDKRGIILSIDVLG